jgi:hypothetical protein
MCVPPIDGLIDRRSWDCFRFSVLRFRLMVNTGSAVTALDIGTKALPSCDSEEKHEPVSDIDTEVVDTLKALEPNPPIREPDIDWS